MDMMYVEDCCEILDSMRVPITASYREEGEYPYYGANGIQDHVADYIFDDELVLLAEDGGNFGSKERPIAYRVSGKCWVNNHAHVLKPKAGLDVDYLCYSLMFYKVDGMVNGATRQKLTQAAMRKMKIPSRSMNEQLHIVDELNRILKIKEQRQRELTLLDDLIKARFVEMFGDQKNNPFRWEQCTIGECCTLKSGTSLASEIENEGGPVPYIKVGDMNYPGNERYITTSSRYVSEATAGKGLFEIGSILFPKRGGAIGTNKKRMTKLPVCADLNVMGVSSKGRLRPEYLLAYFDMIDLGALSDGSSVPQINNKNIAPLVICLPPLELQEQFATFVKQVDKSKFTNFLYLLNVMFYNVSRGVFYGG